MIDNTRVHRTMRNTPKPKFYECGICGAYHSANWDGDCREDAARMYPEELDWQYGVEGWEEVEMP